MSASGVRFIPTAAGMAIRFYCPFCGQLLGIADRKVGAVVVCPRCAGQVGVPSPGAPPPLPSAPAPPPTGSAVILSLTQIVALALALAALTCISFAAGLLVGALG